MNILCVDDDQGLQSVLTKLLQPMVAQGIIKSIRFAFTVADGLRELVEYHPNVVMLDLSFPATPEDNGSTPAETISMIDKFAEHAAVVILTGLDEEIGLWKACISAGALNYLQKQYYFDKNSVKALWHALYNSHLIHELTHPAPYDTRA